MLSIKVTPACLNNRDWRQQLHAAEGWELGAKRCLASGGLGKHTRSERAACYPIAGGVCWVLASSRWAALQSIRCKSSDGVSTLQRPQDHSGLSILPPGPWRQGVREVQCASTSCSFFLVSDVMIPFFEIDLWFPSSRFGRWPSRLLYSPIFVFGVLWFVGCGLFVCLFGFF